MSKNQNGFGLVPIIAILAVIGVIGVIAWSVYQGQTGANNNQQASNNSATDQEQDTTNNSSTQKVADPYEGWESYSNDKYGFSFKYPTGWQIREQTLASPEQESPARELFMVHFAPAESVHDFMAVKVHDMTLEQLRVNSSYTIGSAGAITDKNSGISISGGKYQGLKFSTYDSSDNTAVYAYEVNGKLIVFEDNFGNGWHATEAKLILDSFNIK